MPDWGAIGGANLAAGLLNGLATGYEQASRNQRQDALIQQQRAYQQQDELFRTFAGIVQNNPTMATNPGLLNAIHTVGLDEPRAQALSGIVQAIAADPTVQQAQQQKEWMAGIGKDIRAKYSPEQMAPGVAGPPGPGAPLSQMTPAEGYAVGGAPMAQSIYETGRLEGKGATGKGAKPTVSYHTFQTEPGKTITRKTTIQPDGTVQEENVGTGATYQGRKTRPAGEKEVGVFTQGNAIVQQIDDIEQKIQQNPALANLLASKKTVLRQLGSEATASSTLKGIIGTWGLPQDQADFLSDIQRFVNQDIHDFGGKTVTGREASLVTQQVPVIGQDPKVFLGRLQQTRRNVVRVLAARAQAMAQSGIEAIPEITSSRDPQAAALAARGNQHAKAFLVPPATAAPATTTDVDNFKTVFGGTPP
jgi:hypothetical protein